jgi:hypothetical protein
VIRAELAAVGVEMRDDAYPFSNDPAHSRPWNPDWVTHKVAEAAAAAGVKLDIKGGRHYTARQLLAGGFDLRNTAARLGHSGGGAHHVAALCRPSPRGRPARRRIPRQADRQVCSPERPVILAADVHGWQGQPLPTRYLALRAVAQVRPASAVGSYVLFVIHYRVKV